MGKIGICLNWFFHPLYLNSSWEIFLSEIFFVNGAEIGTEKTIYLNIFVFNRVSKYLLLFMLAFCSHLTRENS